MIGHDAELPTVGSVGFAARRKLVAKPAKQVATKVAKKKVAKKMGKCCCK